MDDTIPILFLYPITYPYVFSSPVVLGKLKAVCYLRDVIHTVLYYNIEANTLELDKTNQQKKKGKES